MLYVLLRQVWGHKWSQISLVGAIALVLMLVSTSVGLTQTSFPPSPLEVQEDDPLLPRTVVDRPLSPQERRVLETALEELRLQGQANYQQGDVAGAFDIWIREVRLRRVLGVEQEVPALARIGEVAWRENQTTETRIVTERLMEIELEVQAQQPPDYDLLLQIAQAYQTLRAQDPAVGLYDEILIQARQAENVVLEQQTLTALGELHLAWFDYPNAAAAYQQLLALARQTGDRIAIIENLRQLAYIYQEDQQLEQAIATQQELIRLFEASQEYTELPALKLAVADNYLGIDRPDLAAPTYQEAFAIARSVQYYGYASNALQRLAQLYRGLDRPDDALVVYQLLVDVEQQSYNSYGLMNAYDWIGQIHRNRGATNQAVVAFRQGLQIARQLNYRVDYFTEQVQSLSGG